MRSVLCFILAAVLIAALGNSSSPAQDKGKGKDKGKHYGQVKGDFGKFDTAITAYFAANGQYPAQLNYLDVNVTKNDDGVYVDPWGTPYQYFHRPVPMPQMPPISEAGTATYYAKVLAVIIATAIENLWAASDDSITAVNYIILSAGHDRTFGGPIGILLGSPGWTPGAGVWATGQPGADDLANFNNGPLVRKR